MIQRDQGWAGPAPSEALGATPSEEPTIARLRNGAASGAVAVAGLCVFVLAGWVFGIPWLTGPDPQHASTSAATALCFILCSAAVYLQARPRQAPVLNRLGPALALLTLAIACYDLTTYIQGSTSAGFIFGPQLGRMAPATATGFVVLSLSLLAGPLARGYVQGGFVAVGLMLAMIDVVCHVYGVKALYNLAPFAAMALSTAGLFVVLYVCVVLSRPDRGWIQYFVAAHNGAATSRLLLPGVITIPFLLSWIMVEADRIEAFDAPFGFAILAVASTFVLGVVLCLASAWLARWEAALRQSNQSLMESERIARGIVDTALDAFVQIDESGCITDWNPQAEALFGWSRTQALGKPLGDLIVPPASREPHNAGLARFLQTGDGDILGKRLEVDALRKDGRMMKVELTITALTRRGGYVFNGFIRDLTEKLAMEARLQQSEKMEAIGNLTGGIAHDFNNLLAVIVGNLDELQLVAKENPDVTVLADMALSAALRGADLTQRLLAFARKQPLQPRPVALNALLSEHVKLLSPTLGEAVKIELDLAADAWPIIADPAQLEAAILNLAANARDAMPDGGKITIATSNCCSDEAYAKQVSDLAPGDYVVVEVLDNGTGMPPEVRNRIFEPFYTTKERGKGTGLGLAMVFGFVKQSNGHISVYSEPGVGTTFRLYFPRATVAGEKIAPEIAAPIRHGRGETVLVVEDNADLRKLTVKQGESLGYRVLEAENAQTALAVFEREAVNLLFSDVVMPGGCDGVELARQILARAPETRIVLTSGFADSSSLERFGTLARSVQLLRKPYRKEQLSEALRSALDSKPQYRLTTAP